MCVVRPVYIREGNQGKMVNSPLTNHTVLIDMSGSISFAPAVEVVVALSAARSAASLFHRLLFGVS